VAPARRYCIRRDLSGSTATAATEVPRKLAPKHEKYLQGLVDHYWSIVEDVCAQYPTCSTDDGLMQTMKLDEDDLAPDLSHLSVAGHHQMAAMIFQSLYG
jgi:hypothetical protein